MILKSIFKQKKYHAEENATEHKLISNWTSIESVENKDGVEYQNIIGEEPYGNYTGTIAEIYDDIKNVADAITARGVYTDITADTETLKNNIHAIPNKITYYGSATYGLKTNMFNISPYNTGNIGMIQLLIPANTTVRTNYSLSFYFTKYSDGTESVNYFGDKNDLKLNIMKKESFSSYEDALLQPASLVKTLEFGIQPKYISGSGYNKWYRLKGSYSLEENTFFDYSQKEKYVVLFYNTSGQGLQPISYQNTATTSTDMTGSANHLCGSMTLSVELIYS